MPLWLTVLLLLVTRIEPIGVRDIIQDPDPNFDVDLGYLFKVELSPSFVFRISRIFGLPPGSLVWKYELLYVPFLLPFVIVSIVTVAIFRRSLPEGATVFSPFLAAGQRCRTPRPTLFLPCCLFEMSSWDTTPEHVVSAQACKCKRLWGDCQPLISRPLATVASPM